MAGGQAGTVVNRTVLSHGRGWWWKGAGEPPGYLLGP